jgi:hypothetical protein
MDAIPAFDVEEIDGRTGTDQREYSAQTLD